MKRIPWFISITVLLVGFSILTYSLQIIIFHKSNDTFFYMLQDLSFVPIQVLMVTFIIDRLMQRKEKQRLMKKIHMVIGVFFNEMGLDLVNQLKKFILNFDDTRTSLLVTPQWTDKDFKTATQNLKTSHFDIELKRDNLENLRELLKDKRNTIIKILENSNILEHTHFTDMLLAVSHLADELIHRETLVDLPENDLKHLTIDFQRVMKYIFSEWLSYMLHLKNDYPYLFSLAIRINPCDEESSVIIE